MGIDLTLATQLEGDESRLQPTSSGQGDFLSPGPDSEVGSARSRMDSDWSELDSPAARDASPSPKLAQSTSADITIRLFDKVVDLLESNPERVSSLWIGAYVQVEDHGLLLKHFSGTNPFDNQPPFTSSKITNGGRTTWAIMDTLLDIKGVQVDPRDAESIAHSLRGHTLLGRSSSLDEMSLSMLMEGVPPTSPRTLTLTPSPASRQSLRPVAAIEDASPAVATGDVDELDELERQMAALNAPSPIAEAASAELAALKAQLEKEAKAHADELAAAQAEATAAKTEAAAAKAEAAKAEARASSAIAEVAESSAAAASTRSDVEAQAQAHEEARDEKAALDASLRALEADFAEVKRERDLARAATERARAQAEAASAAAKSEAAAAAAAAADVAAISSAQGGQMAQVQEMSARHQQELAALRREREELFEASEQHRVELQSARAASSEHAQRLREQEAEHRAAEAARSVEHSKLKADMAERAEVVASMAAAAAVNVDDIDEAVRLQRRVQDLEEQLATGRQAAVSANAADTSVIQIELERAEAENRGLQNELATQQERRVKQSTEHAQLLAENSKLHAQLRRQASEQQATMVELRELRSAYDDLVNVTTSHTMGPSAVDDESIQLPEAPGQAWDAGSISSTGTGNGFDTVRTRAQAVQRQVEALEQEMRDLVITSPFSPAGALSPVPQLSATRSTSRSSMLSSPALKTSSFVTPGSPGSPLGVADGLFASPSKSPEQGMMPFELGAFLRQHELGHFEDALRELGALSMDGLKNTSLSELNDLGMTTVEKLRFRRSFKAQ
jgi:hypothetical protein